MFDLFAKLLSSIATFLFPVFASYKALKTSDPALLTPWLMYWVVLACALLVESWTEFILVWIPFYPWIRAGFLLYLIAPQTQGAKVLYQTYVHPFLQEHETAIEDFVASAHEKAKAAGLSYFKQGIQIVKQHVLGLPPSQPSPPSTPSVSYTQSLISRFNLPSARPTFPTTAAGSATSTANDFYSLLASAVTAATSAGLKPGASNTDGAARDLSNSGTLIPPSIAGPDRMSFIAAQRERLAILLSALDKEADNLQTTSSGSSAGRVPSTYLDSEADDSPRPASAMSGLTKSKSEVDFEKIEKDETNDERPAIGGRSGSWLPWSWGAKPSNELLNKDAIMTGMGSASAKSSGVDL